MVLRVRMTRQIQVTLRRSQTLANRSSVLRVLSTRDVPRKYIVWSYVKDGGEAVPSNTGTSTTNGTVYNLYNLYSGLTQHDW